jgi:hypothetical protein
VLLAARAERERAGDHHGEESPGTAGHRAYCVVVPVLGVLVVAEPDIVPAAEPVAEPVVEPVPPAPMEVPLPVPVEAVVSFDVPGVVVVLGAVLALVLLLEVSAGVDGVVLEVVEVVSVLSFLLHADSDRAAIRARAAQVAIGDLIIRNSLGFASRVA